MWLSASFVLRAAHTMRTAAFEHRFATLMNGKLTEKADALPAQGVDQARAAFIRGNSIASRPIAGSSAQTE